MLCLGDSFLLLLSDFHSSHFSKARAHISLLLLRLRRLSFNGLVATHDVIDHVYKEEEEAKNGRRRDTEKEGKKDFFGDRN